MGKWSESVAGSDGRPVQGAYIRIYQTDGTTPASVFSDAAMTAALAQPVQTNTLGYYTLYAADNNYVRSITASGVESRDTIQIVDDVAQAALIARAIKVPQGEVGGNIPAVADRAGKFLGFDGAGNAIALTGSGADAALRTDLAAATGAGLIGLAHGNLSQSLANASLAPQQFAGAGDLVLSSGIYGSYISGTDNLAPLNSSTDAYYYTVNNLRRMSQKVQLGPSGYYMSGTYEPISIVNIEGQGGGADNVVGSILRFPANTVGFRFNDYNQLGGAYTSTGHPTSNGSKLRQIYLLGGGGTDLTKAGIRATATLHAEHLTVDNFSGRGIDLSAHDSGTGSDYGNTNGWYLNRVTFRAIGGDAALYFDRNNCNAGVGIAVQVKSAQNAGVIDSAAYTNNHIGYEFDSHGLSRKGCVQHNGGAWLAVTKDTAALGSTEPGTNSAIWHYYAALASPNGSWPAWVSGGSYMSGIAFIADSTDNRGVLLGPYVEASDQGLINTADAGMIVIGGNADCTPDSAWLFRGLSGASNAIYSNVGIGGRRNHRQEPTALTTYGTDSSIAIGLYLGSEYLDLVMQNGLDGRLSMQMVGPQVGTGRFGLGTQGTGGAANFWFGTGARSTELFGCTTAFQFFFMPTNFIVPDRAYSRTNSRRMSSATAMPSSGEIGRGELVLNSTPSAGGAPGWVCTTGGVAGSTAVLKAMANLAA